MTVFSIKHPVWLVFQLNTHVVVLVFMPNTPHNDGVQLSHTFCRQRLVYVHCMGLNTLNMDQPDIFLKPLPKTPVEHYIVCLKLGPKMINTVQQFDCTVLA
jgi:hypothetical protein